MIDIQVSEQTTNRLHAILSSMGEADEKVLKPALNRGLTAGKTAFNKQIKTVYDVPPAVISQYSTMGYKKVEMRSDGLIGSIEFAGRVIPLYKFNVSPKKPNTTKTPSAAALKENTPVKFDRKNDTFVAQMKTGHIGVFSRRENVYSGKRYTTSTGMVGRNKHNQAIKELYGPSVPRMAENAVVLQTVEDRVNEVINKRIEHEVDRILSGGN